MVVVNNIVRNSDVGVVLFQDSGARVLDNLIESIGGQAVDVNSGATNDVIGTNTVTGTGLDGIDMTGASAVAVSGNIIENTGGYGIGLNLANGNDLVDNQILTTGTVYKTDGGIVLDRSSNTVIEYNLIEYAASDGIDVGDATGETIVDNNVSFNGTVGQGQGMLLSTVTNSSVNDNTVSYNHTDGIELAISSSGVVVSSNTVNHDGGDGIALGATSASTVELNNVSYNGTNIDLVASSGNTIYDNTADNASGVGIRLDATSTGNSVTYNTARQMPFSAKSTTRKPSQTTPCALRKSTVESAARASATIKRGLRQPIRLDHNPTGNWARPESAARVETIPIARSERPFSPRYSGKYGRVKPIAAMPRK